MRIYSMTRDDGAFIKLQFAESGRRVLDEGFTTRTRTVKRAGALFAIELVTDPSGEGVDAILKTIEFIDNLDRTSLVDTAQLSSEILGYDNPTWFLYQVARMSYGVPWDGVVVGDDFVGMFIDWVLDKTFVLPRTAAGRAREWSARTSGAWALD